MQIYKNIFTVLTLCLSLFFFTSDAISSARILFSGDGEIGIKGHSKGNYWPEGTDFPKRGAYNNKKLLKEDYPNIEASILNSWSPQNFTDLKRYKEGEELENFKLIVHGVELKHLVKGIDDCSFDDFVHSTLNSNVPLGDDFITYYPYFFHKKTLISASVISNNLTATFGNAGFILKVPVLNYLFCGKEDIHTPTDKDFYKKESLIHESFPGRPSPYKSDGDYLYKEASKKHRLLPLSELLPQTKVVVSGDCTYEEKTAATAEEHIEQHEPDFEEETKEELRKMGIDPEADKAKTRRAIEFARKGWAAQLQRFASFKELNMSRKDASIVEKVYHSWYNEAAISPTRDTSSNLSSVSINGIFLREAPENLPTFLEQSHVKKLLSLARKFNLPVIHIYDGNYYKTDL